MVNDTYIHFVTNVEEIFVALRRQTIFNSFHFFKGVGGGVENIWTIWKNSEHLEKTDCKIINNNLCSWFRITIKLALLEIYHIEHNFFFHL